MALLLLLVGPVLSQGARRPNILLLFADDMGYGDLGCYGSTQIKTPHLDRLAATGVRCTQAYVTGPVCAPSRAGLISGQYPQRFGFEHNLSYRPGVDEGIVGVSTKVPTMATRLKRLGYRTGIIGKWHLGRAPVHHPLERGFDRFLGMIKGHHGYFPTLDDHQLLDGKAPLTRIRTPYLTDLFTDEAIDFMGEKDDGTPWFLFLSFNTPHTPMQARDDDLARYSHVKPKRRRAYCAMQHRLDVSVGRLVARLRETGQLENTLVVFMNDNGGSTDVSDALNAPLRGQKSMFLEGGIRVPCLFSWGAGLPAGTTYDHPIMGFDLLPTFVAAAGAKARAAWKLDGVDLLPYLRGDAAGRPHHRLFWRLTARGAAIRDGDLKLIRLPHRPPLLFDVVKDVAELNDLASARPEDVRRLMAELHAWECTMKNPAWISGPRWAAYNRKLYERKYQLTQPK